MLGGTRVSGAERIPASTGSPHTRLVSSQGSRPAAVAATSQIFISGARALPWEDIADHRTRPVAPGSRKTGGLGLQKIFSRSPPPYGQVIQSSSSVPKSKMKGNCSICIDGNPQSSPPKSLPNDAKAQRAISHHACDHHIHYKPKNTTLLAGEADRQHPTITKFGSGEGGGLGKGEGARLPPLWGSYRETFPPSHFLSLSRPKRCRAPQASSDRGGRPPAALAERNALRGKICRGCRGLGDCSVHKMPVERSRGQRVASEKQQIKTMIAERRPAGSVPRNWE